MHSDVTMIDVKNETSGRTLSRKWRYVLALVGLIILLIPIWTTHYVPLVDYANHLARTFVLVHMHDPAYQFDSWYRANWGPYPYLTMDVLLILFQQVVSVYTASKLLLSLTVIGVPLGIWAFARRANPGQDPVALWSLPIAYGTFFLMGSISMRLSMALMFATLALWLRYVDVPGTERYSVREGFTIFLLLTLVYFTHVFGFVLAGMAMTVYGLLTRKPLRVMLPTWLSFIPGVALYLYVKLEIPAPRMFIIRDFKEKLIGLSTMLRGYSNPLDALTFVALLACVFIGAWKNPEFRINKPWFAVALLLFVGYWFAPLVLGEAWDVDIRLLEFSLAFAIVAANFGKRARIIGAIAVLIFVARMANTTYNFYVEEKKMEALAHGDEFIARDARVLPIIFSKGDRQFRKTYLHFWSYGIIDRGWRSSNLFHDAGVHTIANKLPVYNPTGFASPAFRHARQWDLIRRDYDYLWTYNVAHLYPDLDKVADPVFTEGKLRIYKVREPLTGTPLAFKAGLP